MDDAGRLCPVAGRLLQPGAAAGPADSQPVDLLYIADTLDARLPGRPVVPATRLGPATRIGQAPWITGANARFRQADGSQLDGLLDASLSDGVQTGGYAVLGAVLQRLRDEAGPENSLTLENGQCWNGSGLAYLTRGLSGVQGSQLLGSEVRVSSDERVLWPEQCQGLYQQFGHPVLGAGLASASAQRLATPGMQVFRRGGVRIAVVGITDPYARDQQGSLKEWLHSLQPVLTQAREEADLVVALADVGTGPGFWLAERLSQVDLMLCARGQDLWPQPVEILQSSGKRVPVVLGGTRASGAFRIRCQAQAGQWRFDARFLRPRPARWTLPPRPTPSACNHACNNSAQPTRRGSTNPWPRPRKTSGAAMYAPAVGIACCTRPWPASPRARYCCRACAMTAPWPVAR